jgi:hypothetical protein
MPSSQGSGITRSELPLALLFISTYHNTTATKKQALQKTVILEKKRMESLKGLKFNGLRFVLALTVQFNS